MLVTPPKLSSTQKDARRIRSQRAIEETVVYFYATHGQFEKVSVLELCREAKVSTPTFYRIYSGIGDVVVSYHLRTKDALGTLLENYSELAPSLLSLFYFVKKHRDYYLAATVHASSQPFEEILDILRPKILSTVHKVRHTRRSLLADRRICHDIGSDLVTILRWWIIEESFSEEKIDEHLAEIKLSFRKRIEESENRLRRDFQAAA